MRLGEDSDGAATFTKATPNPRTQADYSGKDEPLTRASIVPYAYQDMRGNWWIVTWGGSSWNAVPTKATATAYGLQEKKMFSAASDATALIDGIEERLEIARVNAKSEFPWVLVLIALFVFGSKKGR